MSLRFENEILTLKNNVIYQLVISFNYYKMIEGLFVMRIQQIRYKLVESRLRPNATFNIIKMIVKFD